MEMVPVHIWSTVPPHETLNMMNHPKDSGNLIVQHNSKSELKISTYAAKNSSMYLATHIL